MSPNLTRETGWRRCRQGDVGVKLKTPSGRHAAQLVAQRAAPLHRTVGAACRRPPPARVSQARPTVAQNFSVCQFPGIGGDTLPAGEPTMRRGRCDPQAGASGIGLSSRFQVRIARSSIRGRVLFISRKHRAGPEPVGHATNTNSAAGQVLADLIPRLVRPHLSARPKNAGCGRPPTGDRRGP